MTQGNRSTVVGVFQDAQQAQQAIKELRQAGFREDEIGVISREGEAKAGEARTEDRGSHAGTGAVTGAVAGAGTGALWALGIAAGVLPAIGPVVAGGILASILASAAGTAVAGGILGALIGLGIPEEEARYYEEEFQAGRTIVTVRTESRFDEARSVLQRHGAYDQSMASAAGARASGAGRETGMPTAPRAGAEQTMRLHEEQLHVHKQPQQTGEVRVRKEAHTEHKTLDVPVEREEVVIERHPASGRATGHEGRGSQELRVPVTEEQVHMEKQPVAREDVKIGKHKVKDTETVAGDVCREEAKVEHEGDVKMRNAGTEANRNKGK